MKTVLVIDSMNIAYKMFFKLPHLTNSEGLQTTAIYGFLVNINSLFKKFNPDVMVLTWDSKNSLRKKIYPAYKQRDRSSIPFIEDFIKECAKLKSKLEKIGFPTSYADGLESDDIIAILVRNPKYKYIIASTDNDLYQLLDDNISIWNNKELITKEWFESEYNFHPKLFTVYKAINGCSTDNVKGIYKFGEKKTKKLMKECNYDFDNILKEIKLLNYGKEFDKSLRLVALPFNMDYSLKVPKFEMNINRKGLVNFLYENDIHSIDISTFCNKDKYIKMP